MTKIFAVAIHFGRTWAVECESVKEAVKQISKWERAEEAAGHSITRGFSREDIGTPVMSEHEMREAIHMFERVHHWGDWPGRRAMMTDWQRWCEKSKKM